MTNTPWKGAARPISFNRLTDAADQINAEPSAIRAVWMTEAGGKYFYADGSLIRRFEPHKMPRATTNWRDSFGIKRAKREQMFQAAYERSPVAALNATSVGAPQIMGFNAEMAGYEHSHDMTERMADDADEHVTAFINLITNWGLDTALRAKDWEAFTRRYNGSGQVKAYSAKIEANYRRVEGRASPVVLREGSSGAAVRELQKLLGVRVNGNFDQWTETNLIQFQASRGLVADGIVGAKTWAELRVTDPPVKKLRLFKWFG